MKAKANERAGQLADMAVQLRAEAEEETALSLSLYHEGSNYRSGLAADRAKTLRVAARLVQEAAEVLAAQAGLSGGRKGGAA
jgi:hypothetical protein